jgi:dTDP-4-amino-4,6-dideoxygalactose transaminase
MSSEDPPRAPIPYVDLARANARHREALLEAVGRVIDHGQYILGPEVEAFEKALAERLGAEHVVGVGSGTAALTLGLSLAGVGPGDEVVAPSHSFVATASAIALVGARPVFADVDPRTCTLSADAVAPLITERTKAIVPVHLGGIPCDMPPLCDLAEEHGLALVEDAAQAIGAALNGRSVGTFGIGCFSLHPLKTLSALGDGGFIVLPDAELAAAARRMRNLGLVERGVAGVVAPNSRLDTVHAAMLLVKLEHFDEMVAARRAHAAAYRAALADHFELVAEPDGAEPAYSTFVVRHPRRDELIRHAASRGIDLKVHYPTPIHRQPAFADLAAVDLPVTERVVSEIVSLPVSPELGEGERERVVECLGTWAEGEGR